MTQQRKRLQRVSLFIALAGAFLVSSSGVRAQDVPEEQGHVERRGGPRYVFAGPLGRGYLGVELMNLTPELRLHFGVPEDTGVMVAKLEPESPAEQAGVRVGDILTDVDGNRVDSPWTLSRYIREKEEGDSVSLGLWREGGAQAVLVTLAERERQRVWLGGPDPAQPGVRVFEKGPFVWDGQNLRIGDEDLTTALGEALQNLEERFNSEEWQQRLKRIQSMDWEGVRKRMEELETRLKALEQELHREESEQEGDPNL